MQNKTKKYRVRIKNICIPSNKLFQVPFKTEQIKRYKGISDSDCIKNDCFFQVMTVLGLRHYSLSRKDSLRVKKTKSSGVETRYAAVYLSLIFNATIKPKYVLEQSFANKYSNYKDIHIPRTNQPIHIQLNTYLDLDNGYATFICGLFIVSDCLRGHFFIIYKENDTIYYYDQSKKKISENIYDIISKNKFVGFFMYYNESKEHCLLMKDKINSKIPIC